MIIHGNCIEEMKKLPDNHFKMIFADPPYNLAFKDNLYRPDGSKFDSVDEEWDKFDKDSFYQFNLDWLTECHRVLDNDGTIFICGQYQNIYSLGYMAIELDFWILNELVWIKPNPPPNFLGVRFTAGHESIIWAAKSKESKYTFNYQLLKTLNGGKQMRAEWNDFGPPIGGEVVRNNQGKRLHPTQKPEALLYRCVIAATNPGDLILDPFLGVGTTMKVGLENNRKVIGIEKELNYVEAARKRIQYIKPRLL